MKCLSNRYAGLYRRSLSEPEGFWAEAASSLFWDKPWDQVIGPAEGTISRWFVGGLINACYNCVDRHVDAGHGDQTALIYESPVTGASSTLSFADLKELTARIAGAMAARGVSIGDRVLIYMPNSLQAVAAMLACARIGAIHSVVFGGFAAPELAIRIDDARPKLVISASCGVEGTKTIPYQPILEVAYAIANYPPPCGTMVWQRPLHPAKLDEPGWHDWDSEIEQATPAPCLPVASTHPLYILYTSGTTGQPKGIVRDTGGHLVALSWTMQGIYDCPPGETFWAASDVGWVVGHSYICFGPLLNRNASVIFEGKPVGTPDAGIFWRIIAKHKVRAFFTAPTALRAIKQSDPVGELKKGTDLSHLRAVFLAGERTDPPTLQWTEALLQVPVIDHWWQTETGSAICANPIGIEPLKIKPGSSTVPMPGWDISCLDENGIQTGPGKSGAIVARLPLPPGFAPTLWEASERYRDAYLARYPGYYLTGDAGYIDEDGYVFVMARIDDVINVAGHRLSSSAMEEVLAAHPEVAECAVIGKTDELKGQVPMGFVVVKATCDLEPDRLIEDLVASIRNQIGPVASLKEIHVVARLPKTRSGKILRKTIRELADGGEPVVPATIEDASVLDEYRRLLSAQCGEDRG